jgi:hypothetical protein
MSAFTDLIERHQHWAMVDNDLTELIDAYQGDIGMSRIEHLDYLLDALCCLHCDDGSEVSPEDQISTLAYVAAAAIDRLARKAR